MSNPLLTPSTLPFELPDYASVADSDFREAILAALDAEVAALEVVATDDSPASVATVLEAWERASEPTGRVLGAFWTAKAADTNDERDALETELAPVLAAHQDRILMDARLHGRLVALADRRDAGEVTLDEEESHLLAERLREYERGGVLLDESGQTRLKELNAEIASLSTAFDHLLVAARNAGAVHVTERDHLAGLSEDEVAAAAETARTRDLDGWVLELTNTSQQPLLASLDHRPTRERLLRASLERGLDGEHDSRDTLLRIVRLRAERARLLGHPHHASYVAADGCARTTETVNDILGRLGPAAVARVREKAARLQAELERVEPGATVEPWDYAWLTARLAQSDDDGLDHGQLRPWLEFERVLTEGVFSAATALYGITFHERPELVGYTGESRVFEVREEDGSVLGAVVIDPWTRATKQGGAWMTNLVDQSGLMDAMPVVTNTCNFPPPAPGAPSLLTWSNVITLFHEFGHDLHGLLSDVRFPSRSGTAVPRDFVEYPSQVNEIWAVEPSLLARYAVHHETGEALPEEWSEQLRADQPEEPFVYAELLVAMILDQAWYQADPADLPEDGAGVEAFEQRVLEEAGVADPLVPPRYRSTYFHHVFGGGYSAAYYSYLWSQVFDADTVAWFRERGGMTRENGEVFRRRLLGRGGSVESTAAYREFRGADPDLAHLLARIGVG